MKYYIILSHLLLLDVGFALFTGSYRLKGCLGEAVTMARPQSPYHDVTQVTGGVTHNNNNITLFYTDTIYRMYIYRK